MKRKLTIASLALLGLFAFPAAVKADHWRPRFNIGFGFGFDGGYVRGGYSNGGRIVRHHIHARTPIYNRVWVPAVYDNVIIGRDHCGRPICRTVLVRCGYYESVIVGYRCGECRAHCD